MYRLSSGPASCSSSVNAAARSLRSASTLSSSRSKPHQKHHDSSGIGKRAKPDLESKGKQKQKEPPAEANASTRNAPSQGDALVWRNPKFQNFDKLRIIKDTKHIIKNAVSLDATPTLPPNVRPSNAEVDSMASLIAGSLPGQVKPTKTKKPIPRVPSTNLQKFEAEQKEEEPSSLLVVSPGDFIETRRNNTTFHGIVLAEEWCDRHWRLVTLSTEGEIWKPLKADIMFVVPGAASRDLVSRCGTDTIAQHKSEISARVELLRSMRAIEREVTPLFNGLQQTAHRVHETVALEDEWTAVTMTDAAGILQSRRLNIVFALAVHKVLMGRSLEFVADRSYQSNGIMHVRPRSHLKTYKKAMEAIRSPDGVLKNFVAKAKPFMLANRERQRKAFGQEPTVKPFAGQPAWTEDELAIIDFLRHAMRQTRSNQIDPYLDGCLAVLRALDLTKGDIKEGQLWDVLIDLGVVAPWQDLISLDPELAKRPAKTKKPEVPAARHDDAVRSFLKKQGLHVTDPLEDVRHNFGSMPVYVVDDVGAEELDDGISIELIPNEPGNAWLHTHVADPASVLPPTHPWSIEAGRRISTVYFNHQTLPLLDPTVMRLSSLGSSAKSGKPERVITFSAKLDEKGNILDYKVRAGLVNNVKVLRYDALDEALGLKFHGFQKHDYPFGGGASYAPSPAKLTPTEMKDVRRLYDISRRMIRKRYEDGVIAFAPPHVEVMFPKSVPIHPPGQAMEYSGFPNWTYRVQASETPDSGSRSMVAESMKIAGRVASLFCRDRGIAAIRRTVPPPMGAGLDELRKLRNPERNTVSTHDLAKHEIINLSASYSLEPMGHDALGVPDGEGYCRATSPLRRYADLVLHWQIQAALLQDAKSPNKIAGLDVFTPSWLNEFKAQLFLGESRLRGVARLHEKFWNASYLKTWLSGRYKHEEEKHVENRFDAWLVDHLSSNAQSCGYGGRVFMPKLGIQADLVGMNGQELGKADWTKVKIEDVVLGGKPRITVTRV